MVRNFSIRRDAILQSSQERLPFDSEQKERTEEVSSIEMKAVEETGKKLSLYL
jgi:hypothetical protein